MRLAFGDCLLDSTTKEFFRKGEDVHLTPKAFQLLETLLKERPKVLSKEDLLRQLWPETFVTEGSLANLISEIREALQEDARKPEFLRTVHGVGYSFCGRAREVEIPPVEWMLPARFRLVSTEGEFNLEEGDNSVGRAEDCRVRIESPTVSRHHACVKVSGDKVSVEDLGSKNGTYVRSQKIQGPEALQDGDVVQFGSIRLVFRVYNPEGSTASISVRVRKP
jgi:DNA-binding winged helix-turn-helix (wHTH) protein